MILMNLKLLDLLILKVRRIFIYRLKWIHSSSIRFELYVYNYATRSLIKIHI